MPGDRAAGDVQPRRRFAEHEVDRVVRVPGMVAEPQCVLVELAGQEFLGQRRAVVRKLGLCADHAQRPS